MECIDRCKDERLKVKQLHESLMIGDAKGHVSTCSIALNIDVEEYCNYPSRFLVMTRVADMVTRQLLAR